MKNYQTANVGLFQKLNSNVFAPEGTPIKIEGKLFLGDLVGLSSMEISLNKIEAGTGMSFFHRHTNHEEAYIFMSGEGEMSIDDEIVPIKEGSVVCVKPDAKRSWWNTGDTDLSYIVIQAPAGGMKAPGVSDGVIMEGTVPWVQASEQVEA